MDLDRLNSTLLDRLRTTWDQQDDDWMRRRKWNREDRSRRMTREDAAFGHQKTMWGMQEDRTREQSGFLNWYRGRFQNEWQNKDMSGSGLTGGPLSRRQRTSFSTDEERKKEGTPLSSILRKRNYGY